MARKRKIQIKKTKVIETKRNKIKQNLNFSDFLVKPFKLYFDNLHIALPYLLWLVLLIIIISLSAILFFAYFGKYFVSNTMTKQELMTKFISSFSPTVLIFLLFGLVFAITIMIISSWLAASSTFVFARNIVNGKRDVKNFKDALKKSFLYSNYWIKYALVLFFKSLPAILYVFISLIIILILSKSNLVLTIATGLALFIFGFGLYLLISIPEYCLVYFDSGLFESFKISIKIVKNNYLQFLALFITVFFIQTILAFIFSVFFRFDLLVNFLFFEQYKALVFMLFIKEKIKSYAKK